MDVRPTADRLRESLFNILQLRIEDARFLDLCAGSGAIGIEALSRGASHVTFIDRSRKSCGLIEANLDLCGVPEEITEVVMSEAVEFVRRRAGRDGDKARWDVVYCDPPYATDYAPMLGAFGLSGERLLADEGIVIAEHHHRTALPEEVGSLRRWRTVKHGNTSLSFYEQN